MENRAPESGLELVLDNRKLIIAFALLITICGCFFVLGFIEGKRQISQSAARSAAPVDLVGQRAGEATSGEPGGKPTEERAVKDQLDWYKSVNGRGDSAYKSSEKPAGVTAQDAVPPKPQAVQSAAGAAPVAVKTQAPAAPLQPSYSVQIGAFRDRSKADVAAKTLKSKGYESYIEPSDTGVFYLRIGKFKSRPEAVEMMHRLKKDGFATIIKAN